LATKRKTPARGRARRKPAASATVFVVHGRNEKARRALFDFLRALNLHPVEWLEAIRATRQASPYVGKVLDVAFKKAAAVVVLMTPDEEARLKKQYQTKHDSPHEKLLSGQARPNVLFEAGMALGRNPDRTVIVHLGTIRPFSDVVGRHVVNLSNDLAKRQELRIKLEIACRRKLDVTSIDWQTAGDFFIPG